MYSDFIEDRLAQNSEYIALLKKGIQNFEPDWLESNFRQKLKYETLRPVDQFFDNLYFDYDDNEKLFIYKSTYSQAGFKESLKNLEKFAPGLKVDIQEGTFAYASYMMFDRNSDGTLQCNTLPQAQSYEIKLKNTEDQSFHSMPYNWSSEPWTEYPSADLSIRLLPSDSSKYCLFFGDSPYINSVLNDGDQYELVYSERGVNYTCLKVFNADASSSVILDSSWSLIKDQTTGFWYFQLTPGSYSVSSYRIISFKSRTNTSSLTFSITSDSTKALKVTGALITSQTAFKKNGKYALKCNPVLKYIRNQSDFGYYPTQSGQDMPIAIPAYNITVSTTGEIFKDYELFQSRFEYLVQELLFYYGEPIFNFYITFEVNAVNAEKHHLNINSRIYRFANISGAGLYESLQS